MSRIPLLHFRVISDSIVHASQIVELVRKSGRHAIEHSGLEPVQLVVNRQISNGKLVLSGVGVLPGEVVKEAVQVRQLALGKLLAHLSKSSMGDKFTSLRLHLFVLACAEIKIDLDEAHVPPLSFADLAQTSMGGSIAAHLQECQVPSIIPTLMKELI